MLGLWRRIRWPVVALLGWSLAAVFGTVAAIQCIELQGRHLHVEWGDVPGWIGGVGTFAAFAALAVAALQWRAAQAERRDRMADQARLIIAVPETTKSGVPPRGVVISNQSESPVLEVLMSWREPNGVIAEIQHNILPPGAQTTPWELPVPRIFSVLETIEFHFTDLHGRRWSRTGSEQPRLLDGGRR